MTTIDTARLRLRPWRATDAPDLYELAKDPRIGMLCGWKPFECIDDVDRPGGTRQLRGDARIDR